MWIVTLDGMRITSDEFTLADLGDVEKATGQAWGLMNPWTNVGVARGYLAILLRRNGMDDDKAADRLEHLTLAELKKAFDWEGETAEGEPGPKATSLPIRNSSPGAAEGSGGRRKKQGGSD